MEKVQSFPFLHPGFSHENERFFGPKVRIARQKDLCYNILVKGPGERPVNIRLWVKKLPGKPDSSLTFLQDVFGDSWRPISGTETHEALEVWVRCLPRAMLQFVRQYMDRVRVLEPEETAREVEDALRQDFEAYFQRKF